MRKLKHGLFFMLLLMATSVNADVISNKQEEKRMVVVIPSYKNEEWVKNNLESVFAQRYQNYRVIYISDCSPDKTFEMAQSIVHKHGMENKTTLINNTERKGALRNLYEAIHSCDDDEIVVTLDGDDWFASRGVLNYLNRVYSGRKTVWLTHGTYISSKGDKGLSKAASTDIIERNAFREEFRCSHLRTFYAWLFKKIKKEDLLYEGEFYSMAWDTAMMFPMLEMAGTRHAFINKVLYIYNVENPISDWKKDESYQLMLDEYIRLKEKYTPLKSREVI